MLGGLVRRVPVARLFVRSMATQVVKTGFMAKPAVVEPSVSVATNFLGMGEAPAAWFQSLYDAAMLPTQVAEQALRKGDKDWDFRFLRFEGTSGVDLYTQAVESGRVDFVRQALTEKSEWPMSPSLMSTLLAREDIGVVDFRDLLKAYVASPSFNELLVSQDEASLALKDQLRALLIKEARWMSGLGDQLLGLFDITVSLENIAPVINYMTRGFRASNVISGLKATGVFLAMNPKELLDEILLGAMKDDSVAIRPLLEKFCGSEKAVAEQLGGLCDGRTSTAMEYALEHPEKHGWLIQSALVANPNPDTGVLSQVAPKLSQEKAEQIHQSYKAVVGGSKPEYKPAALFLSVGVDTRGASHLERAEALAASV